jgi:molybdopterin-guanine dinucleotide biosynthesis protein
VTFPEADLATLLTLLRPVADLVLVEGFRGADLPTLLFGSEDTRLDPAAEPVIAQIVEEWGPARESDVPIFQRDEIVGIAATVESWLSNATPTGH